MHIYIFIFLELTSFLTCRPESKSKPPVPPTSPTHQTIQTLPEIVVDHDTTKWIELTSDDGFVIDIKYATTDNFVKEAVYPCGRCFLKPAAANALYKVRDELKNEGYKLKLFDCYRPRPVQQKLWDKVPDANYVARPSEGSMHNRGVAVDLTLTDKFGKELDLGTPYDFFGLRAHHDYTDLPKKILGLRDKLKSIMKIHGFSPIRTEWWHYSLSTGTYPLEDWQWDCK